MSYKISILDDHPMVIEGLTDIIEKQAQYQISGIYRTIKELEEGIAQNLPDLLLLDIQLPDGESSNITDNLIRKYPLLKIIVISSLENLYIIKDMLSKGCRGYLVKSVSKKEDVLNALDKAIKGGVYLPPTIHQEFMNNLLKKEIRYDNQSNFLSMREKQIIELICMEHTSNEIAEKLNVSFNTIDTHRKHIFKKLNINNVAQLYEAAQKLGII